MLALEILASLALSLPQTPTEHIKLKNGSVVTGQATAYDADKKVLSFRTEAGKDMNYTLDELDARSVYLVNASLIPKDNGKAQLQLANFARDIGLYAHAGRRYAQAEQADPTLKDEVEKQRAIGRKLAADYCLKNAKDALAKGKTKDAEEWLSTLVEKLPNEPQAEEAAQLIQQNYVKSRKERDAQLESEQAALLQGDLKKGKELYDRMIQRTQDGLTARNPSKAMSLWNGAIDDGEGVLKEIDRLAAKYKDDPKVQDGAVKYRQLTRDQMVDAHLHIASSLTVKSSYSQALKETNAALALDPNNGRALAQRARIEQASSEGLGIDLF